MWQIFPVDFLCSLKMCGSTAWPFCLRVGVLFFSQSLKIISADSVVHSHCQLVKHIASGNIHMKPCHFI